LSPADVKRLLEDNADKTANEKATVLMEEAIARGSTDNVSVICVILK
jgi:serine/threonine protein phosphatase PrpC